MFTHGVHKPAGVVLVTDFDGKLIENDTKQCCHCGGHFIVVKGSGKPHVHCGRCAADTCSNPRCMSGCYPIQKRFDDVEKRGREFWPM